MRIGRRRFWAIFCLKALVRTDSAACGKTTRCLLLSKIIHFTHVRVYALGVALDATRASGCPSSKTKEVLPKEACDSNPGLGL